MTDDCGIEDRLGFLIDYHLRAVRAGIIATYLVVPVLAVHPFVEGAEVEWWPYFAVLGVALGGALAISGLPWERLFRRGIGDRFRYAWSVLDIVLITVLLEVSGGPGASPVFGLYALTTVFFAASYPRRGQIVLLGFTFACYAAIVPGSGLSAGAVLVQLGVLGVLGFMASFLAHELQSQMRAHREAREVADQRARLVQTVARAGNAVNVLDPQAVLQAVVEAATTLGLEAADLCVLDPEGAEYEVLAARGLPDDYTGRRHASDSGVVGRVLAERRTVVVGDYSCLADSPLPLQDLGFRAVVAAPVWVQGRIAAVLGGGTRQRCDLSREEVEAVELLAYQAGRAIENAGQFESEHRMVQRLAELDRLKRDFVSTASHELRTPLTVILGMSTTLLDHWDSFDDATKRELLDRVHANAGSLERIVASLLDVSRLEEPAGPELVDLDLGGLVTDALGRLASLFDQHHLEVDVDPDLRVRADRGMLERVVENLLGNAAKHTPPGTVVRLRVHRDGDEAVTAIEDDGPGITDDELAHLGERFFRGGDPNRRSTRGIGLGLAIVREVLERHDASLTVESSPGRGASFSFRLPLIPWGEAESIALDGLERSTGVDDLAERVES